MSGPTADDLLRALGIMMLVFIPLGAGLFALLFWYMRYKARTGDSPFPPETRAKVAAAAPTLTYTGRVAQVAAVAVGVAFFMLGKPAGRARRGHPADDCRRPASPRGQLRPAFRDR